MTDSPSLSDMRDSCGVIHSDDDATWNCTLPKGHEGGHQGRLTTREPVCDPDVESVYAMSPQEIRRKEPCAGCGSKDWRWRAGPNPPPPNVCSECESPSRPPTDPVPLSELLDNLRLALFEYYGSPSAEKWTARGEHVKAAKESIEYFVTALTEENKKLRDETAEIGRKWAERGERLLKLCASSLTPEEARALLDVLYTLNPQIYGLEQSIDAKLRSLGTPE